MTVALELMASAIGGAVTDPEPGVAGPVPFAGVQLAERRQNRWVLSTAPAKGGFWAAMDDVGRRIPEAMDKINEGVAGASIPALKIRLAALYESLVSPELRATLAAAASVKAGQPPPILRLHLNPGLDMIPWELLADRQQFLGLEFQVARMPIISGGPRPVARRVREVKRIASILGADVVDAALRPEWDATFDGAVVNGNGVALWRSPTGANDWPTVATLPDAFGDIVHVTCHGMAKEGGQRYWSLDRRKPDDMDVSIYPPDGDLQFQLSQTAPLVFANACSSATAAGPRFSALADGFGSSFYDLGASVFIGTIGPVSRRIALEFATRFFHRLLSEGMTAGEALWATKRSFADEGEADPSWLLYCMYGDPEARFTVGHGHGG